MSQSRAMGIMLALATLVAGCSPAPGLTLTLGASDATVVRGDTTLVAVTIARSGGANDTVTLSVSGVPSGVTATFADETLSGGESSTTLTIAVTPAAAEGSAAVTLSAVAGSLVSSATFELTVTSLTVEGRLVDVLGNGFPGAQVEVQGATDTTDEDGAFTIDGVAVPYDLVTYVSVPEPTAHVFVGMTAANPTVLSRAVIINASGYPTATVDGNLPGVLVANHEAIVCVEGIGVAVYGCDTVPAGDSAYSIHANWATGGSISVRVHALVIQLDTDGFPVAYPVHGTGDGAITAGGAETIDVDVFAVPSTTTLSGAMNAPAGFTPYMFEAGVRVSETFTLPLFRVFSPPAATFTNVPVPVFPGGTYGIYAAAEAPSGASSHGWRFGRPGGSSTTIDVPSPPVLSTPADGAVGIGVGDTLALASDPDDAVTFGIRSGPNLAIYVTTMDDHAIIPDLSAFGASLPPATMYTWQALVSPGVATVEGAGVAGYADYLGAVLAFVQGGPSTAGSSDSIVATDTREFTTP